MSIQFYNTYSKQKEVFTPLEDKIVRMYNCGPTVYDYAHIGNFRTFLIEDIVRRYLEYRGFKVRQVMNITDVGHMTTDDLEAINRPAENEDKMVVAMRKTGISDIWELADFFTKAFLKDCAELRCLEPMKRPKASEHIPEMIEIIKMLLKNSHAYESNGFVYYDVRSFPKYGRLSGNTIDDLVAGHRVEIDPNKRHPADFSLWKSDEKHIMKWESPWSVGFPGWHIECSAMAMKYLGETLDIHMGGEDNIFPHHEAEIAQSEGATGKTYCRFWIHPRHLLIDGKKMSKSKGNFFTVKDLLERGYNGCEIRYSLISSHYRQNTNFSTGIKGEPTRDDYKNLKQIEILEESRGAVKRLSDFATSMAFIPGSEGGDIATSILDKCEHEFQKNMDDDINISGALSAVFEMIKEINKQKDQGNFGGKDAHMVLKKLRLFDNVLGVLPAEEKGICEDVAKLIKEREEARKSKNFKRADEIRDQIKNMGFMLDDTPHGTIWKKI